MFDSLSLKFSNAFASLRKKGRIKADDLTEILAEIRVALLDSDVSLKVTDDFVDRISARALEAMETINKSTNPSKQIFDIVHEELVTILGGSARRIRYAKNPPTVILLTGLQGAGKTSLAGKLAKYLKEQGNTPLLVASDLQRPNAVTQLQVVGESVSVPVFAPEPGNGVGDPVAVARAGVKYAKDKMYNIVIVDTAGRLGVDTELMKQAKAIREAINPEEVFFVVDAMIGQDAVTSANAFLNGVGFDAIVLTKLDGDARGGAALSIVQATGRPIIFAATGEKAGDFDLFYPDRMAARILGLGDVQTLAEQAKKAFDGESAEKLETKFARGEDFTLDDFLQQLEAMKKMGSMTKLLGMLPGMNSGKMKKQLDNFDEAELVRTQAIVESMTPGERADPKILNGSRRVRIANGSGRAVSEINNLVDRFTAAQKVMKAMRTGGGKGLPPGMELPPGMNLPSGFTASSTRSAAQMPPRKRSKSGNPAKRAAEHG
jgi:signal recognition particle subunit SRP54